MTFTATHQLASSLASTMGWMLCPRMSHAPDTSSSSPSLPVICMHLRARDPRHKTVKVTRSSTMAMEVVVYFNRSRLTFGVFPWNDKKCTRNIYMCSKRSGRAPLFKVITPLSPKRPLPNLAGTLDEPADQVRRHKQASVLRVVFVPANPEGPPLGVEHLPELLHAVLV